MGWVNGVISELKLGNPVKIRPFVGSMKGRIESGQEVILSPISKENIPIDDGVLVKWKGNFLLHLIKDIKENEVLISNNLGKDNGWGLTTEIIGKVTRIFENFIL